MEIKNVVDELAKHPEFTFLDVIPFNQHKVGALSVTGVAPGWEMHPDTDELFYIIDGEAEFVLYEASGPKSCVASAGNIFAVPKGIWHKPGAPKGAKFFYLTPGKSLSSEMDDPREDPNPGVYEG
jgi:mannose-6-phosphate isomerase-like protein (cupin superfamily)